MNGVEKSPSWVGHIRSRLGFDKKRKSNETVIEDADLRSKLQQHCEEHNLSWQSNDPAEQPDRGHDSGGSTDGTRLKTRLKEHIKKEHPLAEFTPAKVANTFGGDAEQEQIKQALETLAESDGFLERNGGRYNLIGGEL